MAFSNRVRLPIRVLRPQFPEIKTTFPRADGTIKTLSASITKTYELQTDWMNEALHEKLAIVFGHDNVSFEGDRYFGGIVKQGDYAIAWQDSQPNYPFAPAKTTVTVTPFDANNSNCVSCDELSQVVLANDAFPYALNENTTYTLDVINNDSVCCYPVVFTITSYNSDYLSSASIDVNGILTIHTKTGLVSANGLLLVTYRATCANGGYDEADVSGNINGTTPGCLAPLNLTGTGVGNTVAHFAWTAPSPAPDHYFWQLLSDTNVVLQSGHTFALFVDLSGMTANTNYKFQVRSQCTAGSDADGTASNWIQEPFTTTPVAADSCGSYRVFPVAGGGPTPPHQGTITWLNCGGVYTTAHSNLLSPINVCALQSAPGAPYDIHSTFTGETVTYLGLC